MNFKETRDNVSFILNIGIFIMFLVLLNNNLTGDKIKNPNQIHDTIYKVDTNTIKLVKQNLAIAENEVMIDKDSLRIQLQLLIAEKYTDSIPSPKNVKQFCIELFTDSIKTRGNIEDWKVAYGVANKETGFRAGTAKWHNNFFGLKMPRRWKSIAIGKSRTNYCIYEHWTHSFIDIYTRYVVLHKRMWSSLNLSGINKK